MEQRSHPLCEDCYADKCPDKSEMVIHTYRDPSKPLANYAEVEVVVECAGFLPYEGRQ